MMRNFFLAAGLVFGSLTVSIHASASEETRNPHETMARDIYAQIIGIDSSTTGNGTPEMAAYLAGLFREAGFADKDVMQVQTSPQHTSLLVRYRGRDESVQGIGFMAHMDVVPALAKDWELNPFFLTERDGFFIGRGVVDNKAGVAGLTTAFLKLKNANYVPERNMILILTADEETTGDSARHIASEMAGAINIEYAINSDAGGGILSPTGNVNGYFVQGAEKSYRTLELVVRNTGGHSSAPRPDNAIYQLARALVKIEAYQFPVMIDDITAGKLAFMASKADPQTAAAIHRLLKDPGDAEADALVSAEIEINHAIRTTCVATMLSAGHAENALPQSATATVNCRIMPGVEPADIYHTLAKIVDDGEIVITPLVEFMIAGASPMRDDIMAAIKYALGDRYPEIELVPSMSAGATDGVFFRAVGIPVYGTSGIFAVPGAANAHGLNENTAVETFYHSLVYWERLMMRLTGRVGAR